MILKVTFPTPGALSLSLIIANLQLNGVPGLPQKKLLYCTFHCLNFVFQAGQSMPFGLTAAGVHPPLQQRRWQLLILSRGILSIYCDFGLIWE